jgi:hypothetical protein
VRLNHWPVKGEVTRTIDERGRTHREPPCRCEGHRAPEVRPDPAGHYPLDPRTLPPGIAGQPMITLVHMVDGAPQGGVTLMVTLDTGGNARTPSRRRAARRRRVTRGSR